MVYTKEDFNARVQNVDKAPSRLVRRGYTAKVDKNGIIVAQPKSKVSRLRLPVKGALIAVACFFGLKALMLASTGPETYQDRLQTLQNGTFVEALGAKVLAADPATQFLADKIAPFLR